MKLKQADEEYREVAPYLFEDDDPGHHIEVRREFAGEDVYVVHQWAGYVPQSVRDARAKLVGADSSYANNVYEWKGRGFFLTPKQARKLAKELLKAADSGE